MADTVVVGVGNRLRGDDAAGLAVIDLLADRVPAGVRLVGSDGNVTHLLDVWGDAAQVVVVDCVVSGEEAGTVHRLDGATTIPAAWRSPSSHLLGVGEAIELGSLLGVIPRDIVVFGVEAGDIDNGTRMSAPVEAATVRVADEVLELLGSRNA